MLEERRNRMEEEKKIVVELDFEKFTKNKVRFKEPGTEENGNHGIFPIIYIRKDALIQAGMTNPDKIRVTVEVIQ